MRWHDFSRMPLRATAVILWVFTAACVGSEPDQPAGPTDEFGVTAADRLQGIAVVESEVVACMTGQGYDYVPADPDDVLVLPGEAGTGWGMADSFLQSLGLSQGESGDIAVEAPTSAGSPNEIEEAYIVARAECSEWAWSTQTAREAAVAAEMLTIEQAWSEFRTGAVWQEAARRWNGCMETSGYPAVDPLDPQRSIAVRLQAIAEDGIDQDDQQALIDVRREEIALFDANAACRRTTLDPVEQDYVSRVVLTQYAEEAAAIRFAVRAG